MALNLFAPLSEQKKDTMVEFKAGKMNKDSDSRWVRPDKRKGLVQLRYKDDQLVHFIWKDRLTGSEEHDLIIFPDDAVYRKVKEAKARVYVLEFKTNDKKLFFWMQEPKDDKDDQYCADLNKFMNNPSQPSAPAGLEGLGNMDQQQLLQMLAAQQGGGGGLGGLLRGIRRPQGQPQGGPSGATTGQSRPSTGSTSGSSSGAAAATGAGAGANSAISLSFLQNALANAQRNAQNTPSLGDVVDVEHLVSSGLFDNDEVVKKLAEFLPEGTPVTAENMKENVNSPQFKQAISMFNEALRSGELATIMSSFGLEARDIGPNATIEDFLKAIQKQAQSDKSVENMDTEKQ